MKKAQDSFVDLPSLMCKTCKWVAYLPPEFYFSLMGLFSLLLYEFFPLLSPVFLEAVTSSAMLEHTREISLAMYTITKQRLGLY